VNCQSGSDSLPREGYNEAESETATLIYTRSRNYWASIYLIIK